MSQSVTRFLLAGIPAILSILLSWTVHADVPTQSQRECLQNERAYLSFNVSLPSPSTQEKILTAQVRAALQSQGLLLIDPKLAGETLEKRQKELIAMGDAVGAMELAKQIEATLLVKATINGQQRQIRGMAQGLYNVSLQLDLQVLSGATGQVLSHTQQKTRKPGLDMEAQASVLMDILLKDTASKLLSELCQKIAVESTPPSKAEPAGGIDGTTNWDDSPIDSL